MVLGPDACSTLTTTNYFVQALETGRYFFIDDIIIPDYAATYDAVMGQPPEDPNDPGAMAPRPVPVDDAIYLPERDQVSRPAGFDLPPARRLRSKTSPAMLHQLSQAPIEGEGHDGHDEIFETFDKSVPCWEMGDMFENLGRMDTPSWDRDSNESDWTLETRTSPTSFQRSSGSGGGDVGEAPNSQDGGSRLTASNHPDPANLVNLVFLVIYFSSSNYFTLSNKFEKK